MTRPSAAVIRKRREDIFALYQTGKTYRELAEMTGYAQGTIAAYIHTIRKSRVVPYRPFGRPPKKVEYVEPPVIPKAFVARCGCGLGWPHEGQRLRTCTTEAVAA
jgi:hypothetical protein